MTKPDNHLISARARAAGRLILGVETGYTFLCILLAVAVTAVDVGNSLRYFGLLVFALVWAIVMIPLHLGYEGYCRHSSLFRYRQWCGNSSYITQLIIVLLTTATASLIAALLHVSLTHHDAEPMDPISIVLMVLVCVGINAALAIPLGILAGLQTSWHRTRLRNEAEDGLVLD